MNVVHRVTGYDKRTERLTFEFDVPPERLREIQTLGRVPREDADDLGSFPLEAEAARAIAERMMFPMHIEACDWFLEPFAAM